MFRFDPVFRLRIERRSKLVCQSWYAANEIVVEKTQRAFSQYSLKSSFQPADRNQYVGTRRITVTGGCAFDGRRVGGIDPPSPNSCCAKPGALRITKLRYIVGRSSVRSGHTSGRHFGEDAQRIF